MSKNALLSLLLFSSFLHCAGLQESNPDNNNLGLSGGVSDVVDSDNEKIRAIVLQFSSGHLVRLVMAIPTEQAFEKLSKERKAAVLAAFPEFQDFLKESDAAGAGLSKATERCDIACHRIVVTLRRSVTRDALPAQITDNAIPGVTCSVHRHAPSRAREIDRILSRRSGGAGAGQQEEPSTIARLISSVRGRLQRD